MQDILTKAIDEAGPKEAKHNKQGYAGWVDKILDQKEGYRLAHNWTKGYTKSTTITNISNI
eukprot:10219841-Karenia_brevis.AAC.1